MKKLRVLALMHEDLIPPEHLNGHNLATAEWKTEYDVVSTLRKMGHEVRPLGVRNDLEVIRKAIEEWKPHIAFNLLEEFDGVSVYDLSYHRISTPEFSLFPLGQSIKRPKHLSFPLIVKSVSEEASLGISQASIVEDDDKLRERVAFIHNSVETGAIVERYIEGRELYVGVLGNRKLQVLPVWELDLNHLPDEARRIATERVKWSHKYQSKYGITSGEAKGLPEGMCEKIQHIAKRVYRILGLSGYARMDLRLEPSGKVYVLEANPNPQIALGEDFADSAKRAGMSYPKFLQRVLNMGLRWQPDRLG
ncbi:MAG: ATP-grasp domain-containing protein [Candidatus Tectomicrobia bacterium]|uniref:ATP-grasp domain-containing protein n=1 Tax=Tectimicrobiota bacterium TaxID=2528274 RepID=A0A932M162_UNCTE|nr:ATP-grasp domain-containing protein [Candidatus Tectomicrobia bacterium]